MNKLFTLTRLFGLLLLMLPFASQAQVTNASISGVVTDAAGQGLPGATVVAVHQPSGSRYGNVTNNEGRYTLPNVRSGGPYEVRVTFVGYQPVVRTDINAPLGTTAVVNVTLAEDGQQLSEVVVRSQRGGLFDTEKTGAATNISSEQLRALPTISRSLNDFTRLTPQASGNSFGGRDGRYNNITIDGANFNNNFGLSDNNLPGGSAQPISIDAIEEVQVNIAPYDVRQANFTGAGINAVTRSGTNTFRGTAYTYYRDQSFNGKKVAGTDLAAVEKRTNNICGASLGGPLIKNKLFLFVNGEYEKAVRPGTNFVANRGTTGPNVSRTTAADLETISNFVRERYGYETGAYENFANNFTQQNVKLLGRLDWNINDRHKFTTRYTQVINTDDQIVNGTSAPNPRAASNRISQNALSYANSQYGFENSVRSITGELNSTFSNKLSNQLLATYTRVQDKRTSPSSPFPFVDIWKDGDAYISLGYELFSWKNDIVNKTASFIDNLTYYAGKHTLTGGVAYEHMTFGNSFLRYGTSYYRFASMQDFMTNKAPTAFAYTYPVGGNDTYASLAFGQFSAYVQDEYALTPQLKLTAGIRMDQPIYGDTPAENPAVSALTFLDGQKINTGMWPRSRPAWSPRVGFNYNRENSLQVRGGTGIFNGRLPFVWFTNQPTNSGMLQFTYETVTASALSGFLFNPDPNAYLSKLPQQAGTASPSSLAVVSPDFRMPQVWRTNLAVEKKLPGGFEVSLEGLYTKELVTVFQQNINLANPIGTLNGVDNRPIYGATTATRRVNAAISEAMVLSNTDRGYALSLTGQVQKRFANGLAASLAYTFNQVKDITGNPGSQAASAWSGNVAVGSLNNLELANSSFAMPHRIVGSLSYKFNYLGNWGTTVSLFYNGSNQGRFSYTYSADLNRDGVTADLLYVPANPSDITFADIRSGTTTVFTAKQQSDAFFAYIEQDDYLRSRKGQYAERNGGLLPWLNRFDLKLLQDIGGRFANSSHKLQLSIDVLNVGNLLNNSWGVPQRLTVTNGALLRPAVTAVAGTNNANATYQLATVQSGKALASGTFENILSINSVWQAQVGIRYLFN